MTKVINLLGGPSVGKSTLAAEIYYKLKSAQVNCELVREYVKDWAWENRKVTTLDQPLICGKQIAAEMRLYGKVDVIVTDSPIILSPFYQEHYSGHEYISQMVEGHLGQAMRLGVIHEYYLLKRNKPYSGEGRYETEEQAKSLDLSLVKFLVRHGIDYSRIDCSDSEKADTIIRTI